MPHRRAALGLVVAIVAAAGAAAAQTSRPPSALPQRSASGFDGQWSGGFSTATGAQVTVAAGGVVGLFWRGDYRKVKPRPGEAGVLAFAFEGGEGAIRGDGAGGALLILREAGRHPVTISLSRD